MTYAAGADTLIGVLDEARRAGFDATFAVEPDATVVCSACATASAARTLRLKNYRRLEGASDAADMMFVALARCPSCNAGGTVTLGYGPNAGDDDAETLAALDLRDVESGPIS